MQYGLIGWQGGVGLGKNNFTFSVGAPVLSLGYEYAATKKWSFGAQVGMITSPLMYFGGSPDTTNSVHANYHFSEHDSSGWVVGIELVRVLPLFDDNGQEVPGTDDRFPLVSMGYKF